MKIVAGWSKGVVIIEAKEKSGSLITANLALDLGKDLFTIPGEIFKPNSSGCNYLISRGEAKAILKSEDILNEFNIKNNNLEVKKEINFNDKLEENIYNLLLNESLNIDKLSEKLGLDISTTSLKVSFMELSATIKKGDNGKYEII